MAPKISVSLITKRAGGIDVAKYGLLRQTFKDFELLLVDELYEKRHDAVETYFRGSGIDLIHVDAGKEDHPKWRPWSYTVGRSQNLALTYARGEILMICGDYWVYSPTALEATWRAWKTWGRKGLNVILVPHATPALPIRPSFKAYARKRRSSWLKKGGSSFLDAPPDSYISIYAQDFCSNPGLGTTRWDDPRILSVRVDGSMRDPRQDDPPEFRKYDVGAIGGFRYWITSAASAWGLVSPVEDAVEVNGWDDSFNGFWGGWEEINVRMAHAFDHRYVCTMAALAYQLPHDFDILSWTLRNRGKSNKGFPGCNMERVAQRLRAGQARADNPFDIAEERRKLREKGKTDLGKRI